MGQPRNRLDATVALSSLADSRLAQGVFLSFWTSALSGVPKKDSAATASKTYAPIR